MRTYGQIKSSVYDDLGYTSAPPPDVQSRVGKNVNYAHQLVLRDPVCTKLLETSDSVSFASEVGRAVYGLPSALTMLRVLTERDNDRVLYPSSIEEIRSIDPGRNATGTPYRFVPVGYKPIQRALDMATGSGVWAQSTNAGDTQAIRINGIRLGGLMTGDITATLTGVTRVQIGSLTDIIDLQAISLASAAVGVVSLYDAAVSGNVIAQIGTGALAPQYYVIELYPTPEAVTTYYVDGRYRIPELSSDQEVPLLPEEFQNLLEDYARFKEYERRDDERAAWAKSAFDTGFSQLKYAVNTQPGQVPVFGRRRSRFARLGPWTPAEDWSR